MKIFLTKRKTLIAAFLAAVIVCGVASLSIASALAVSVSPNGKTVVLDAGHGGMDGGVVGTISGSKESDINLAIARQLRTFLSKAGYKVVMTRDSSDGLYANAEGSKKKADMLARKRIIESASPDLVISIHQNAYPRKDISGAQVFYDKASASGSECAAAMQSVLNSSTNGTRIAKSGDYYILQCSPALALLIECGFLSNPEEDKKLNTPEYQEQIAYAISTGVRVIME